MTSMRRHSSSKEQPRTDLLGLSLSKVHPLQLCRRVDCLQETHLPTAVLTARHLPSLPNPPLSCIYRGIHFIYSSLLIPTGSIPLLGRDLLAKMGVFIFFLLCVHMTPGSPVVSSLLFLLQTTHSDTPFPHLLLR